MCRERVLLLRPRSRPHRRPRSAPRFAETFRGRERAGGRGRSSMPTCCRALKTIPLHRRLCHYAASMKKLTIGLGCGVLLLFGLIVIGLIVAATYNQLVSRS